MSPTRTGFPKTLTPCGAISQPVKLPANTGTKPKFYTFTVTAKQGTSTASAATMAVVAGTAKPVASITLPATISKHTELSPAVASRYVLPAKLTVPAGLTLTVAPGTRVKSAAGGSGVVLDVSGTLNAIGTATSPITLTSLNDNTVGGVTGNGHPLSSDWGGIRTETTGTIDLEYAKVKYNAAGVVAHGTSSTVKNTAFTSITSHAVITLVGDHLGFTVSGNTGAAGSFVSLSGTATFASVLGASSLPWSVQGCLTVPTGVTVTVQAGTIVKGKQWSGGCGYATFDVSGTLSAIGTSGSPIKFTSMNDNSVGGATGNGSPLLSDWGGFRAETGGKIDLEYASVKYTGYPNGAAVVVSGTGTTTTLLNDTFDSLWNDGVSINGGTVNVSNNHFANLQSVAYAVTGASEALTLKSNTTDSGSGFSVSSNHLNFNNLTGNTTPSGAGVTVGGVVTTSSTLTASTTPWLISGCIQVPAGVALTVQAGAIVKTNYWGGGCNYSSFDVSGTLTAVGTDASPITFTSINDNSIGGATGNGSPAGSDWGGFHTSTTGTIDLEHATIKYAGYPQDAAVYANGPSTTIVNDTFDSLWDDGVWVFSGATANVSNNQFTNQGDGAWTVWGEGIGSGFTMKNNTTDSPLGFHLTSDHFNFDNLTGNTGGSGSTVTIAGTVTTSSTLSASTTPWLINGCLQVPTGVTLTIQAGAIIKGNAWGCTYTSLDISGTLTAVGTNASPITFTSVNDNSVGGATGSGSPASTDWGGLRTEVGGNIDLEHAIVKYAGYPNAAVFTQGTGTTTIVNDTFDSLWYTGVSVNGGGTVNVSNNQFTNLGSSAWAIHTPGTGSGFTMQNNTTDSGLGFLVTSDNLNLDNLTGNTGPSGAGVTLSGTVTTSSTLAASATPWEITTCLQVPVGVTMTVQAGAIVKSSGAGCGTSTIDVSGVLNAVGTVSSPITFTSINDNSIGGATGTGTPAAGDWGGIGTESGGVANCTVFCTISYN